MAGKKLTGPSGGHARVVLQVLTKTWYLGAALCLAVMGILWVATAGWEVLAYLAVCVALTCLWVERAATHYIRLATGEQHAAGLDLSNPTSSGERSTDDARAIADYSRAIELDPMDPTGYNNRGFAYDNLGAYNRAIADYSQAIELAEVSGPDTPIDVQALRSRRDYLAR